MGGPEHKNGLDDLGGYSIPRYTHTPSLTLQLSMSNKQTNPNLPVYIYTQLNLNGHITIQLINGLYLPLVVPWGSHLVGTAPI